MVCREGNGACARTRVCADLREEQAPPLPREGKGSLRSRRMGDKIRIV